MAFTFSGPPVPRAPNGERKLTLTYFLWTDRESDPPWTGLLIDGKRYKIDEVDYLTPTRLVLKDGTVIEKNRR